MRKVKPQWAREDKLMTREGAPKELTELKVGFYLALSKAVVEL